MKKYKPLIQTLLIITAVLFLSGSSVLAASFTEHFDTTTYKDVGQTTADWNTRLGRLQLARGLADNQSYANVTYDGTYVYVGYMASDCVRVAKLDSSGSYVSLFGDSGLSGCISSYWAGPSVFDITVTQGGIYILYRSNLLQRLNATTGAREWVVEEPQDPEGFYTLLSNISGSKGGWTMTADSDGYVYIGGGEQSAGYYITKMENGGRKRENVRRKVLDVYPNAGDADIAINGSFLYLSWEQGGSCFVQKYNRNTLLEEWKAALEISNCSGHLGIAVEPGGNFYLLSNKNNDFEIRKYNNNKGLLWGPIAFNRTGDWHSIYYNAGHVYVVWRDRDWFSYHSIRLQRFNAATGAKLFGEDGLEIKVLAWAFHENNLPRYRPSLIVDSGGSVLVAYTDELSAPYIVEVLKVFPGASSENDFGWRVAVPEGDVPFQSSGAGQSMGYDTGSDDVNYNSFSRGETLNGGSIIYQFSDSSNGVGWSDWISDITVLSQRYVRWKANLSTSDASKSPWVDWISINYTTDVVATECIIKGVSYPGGAYNPDNKCQVCDVSRNTVNWSNVTDGTDPDNWCGLTWDSCDSACIRRGGNGNCYSGSCDITHRTGNIASGFVCTGSGKQTSVSSFNYCNYDEDCDAGDCEAVEWRISCNGSGSCRAASDHADSYSTSIYAQTGYTLTDGCGTTGTASCNYSSWNKCSSGLCQRGRDQLKCDTAHSCAYDVGNDWSNCAAATACSGSSCASGNLCDSTWRSSAGSGDNNYGIGGNYLCQGSCDGLNNCDYALNCCLDNGQNCSGADDCCSNNCVSSVSVSPGSTCCPSDSNCVVEQKCRGSVFETCTVNEAKDYDISQLGNSIDDYWCTVNVHDGCQYVKSGIQLVNGQNNPDFWEGESCGGDGGSSSLEGQKIVVVDDVSKYEIKARVYIDDNSWVWINGQEVGGLRSTCCGWTEWVDVTDRFQTGENTIKFRAEDTCSGDRYFNLDWDVKLKALQCSSLNYPSGKWQRVWYTYPAGVCLGDGPDEKNLGFDNNWGNEKLAYEKTDYIQFQSSRTIHISEEGTYRFNVGSDDGVRLWIDEDTNPEPLINQWVERGYTVDSADVRLDSGNHKIRLDYFENCCFARISFNYERVYTTPSVLTHEAANIEQTSATLQGELKGLGGADAANVWFVWSNSYHDDPREYENETVHKIQSSLDLFTFSLENLAPDTTYHYRAVAENPGGIAYGEDKEFTTKTVPSEKGGIHMRIHAVDENGNHLGWLNDATAKLTDASGEIVYQAKTSSYNDACEGCGNWGNGWIWFDDVWPGPYGVLAYRPGFEGQWKQVDCAENGSLADATIQNANTEGQIAAWDDKAPVNWSEITWCQDLGLRETPVIVLPTISTRAADKIETSRAQLNGELLNLGGANSCNVWFEWGTTTSYGKEIPVPHRIKDSIGSFSETITNLSPETTYHFRAVAENSAGIVYGEDKSFKTLPLAQNQVDLSASKTVTNTTYKKYAFPVQTPSQFNFIGLSGYVAVSSTEAQTLYAALFSIQNVPSGNCPPAGAVWDTYEDMAAQYPGVRSISAFIVRNIGPGRKEVPTEFTFPVKVPITGCIFVVFDGADIEQGKQITMESHMKMIYDIGPAPSPAPYFVQLDHEFCYGLNFPPICTTQSPRADRAFARVIKIDSPVYLWSLTGDVNASTFTLPPFAPSGQWTTEFDYYLYKSCPPPALGNSGPTDYYNQIPNDAENLLNLDFQGNGRGVFHQSVFKNFGPKFINPGSCFVALTRSIADNGGLDNESQVYALVQPAPLTCPDCTVEGQCRNHVENICLRDENISKDYDVNDSIDDYWCTYNEHDGCSYVKSGVVLVNGQVNPDYWEGDACNEGEGTSSLYGEKKVYVDDINKYTIKARVLVDDISWVWINGQEIPGLHKEGHGQTDWVSVISYFHNGWNTIKFRAEDICSGDRYFNLDWDVSLKQPPQQTIDLSASVTVAAKGVFKKYAFPIQTPSQFNFIGLSGYVAVSSTEATTAYPALISIQNATSGNCPPPGRVWDSYDEMFSQYPAQSISNFVVKNVGPGRKEVPTNFTFPIKVPIKGCIFLVLDGSEPMEGKPITMEANMKLFYDTGSAPSPAPYFIQLDHEFCYGQMGCFLWTKEAKPQNAFAKAIKITSPLYLWSLSGNVSAQTFTYPWAGHPTGIWTSNFDYYLYKSCPPPPIDSSGPADYYAQIPTNAENLLSFQFQGNGKGAFHEATIKTFGPKLIQAGNCLVALTKSEANGAISNESQIFALVQPVPGGGAGVPSTDLNNDGSVNSDDFKTLLKNWGTDFDNPAADLNSDGVVDSEDLEIMQEAIEQ